MIHFSVNYSARTSLHISGEIQINCSKEKLWKIISEPGHLENYHPFCEYHRSEKWDGVGSTDESKSYYGKIIKREVISWDEGKGYQIRMLEINHNTKVKFEIYEKSGLTHLKVWLISDAYRNNPRPIWFFLAPLIIVPSYKKYFNSLLKGLKFFTETGQKVERNQFGHHSKYSPKIPDGDN